MSNEVVKLVKVSAGNNNNKFYNVTLEGDTVTTHWGRVGTDGTKRTEHTGKVGFDRIVRSKKSRGYKEVATVESGTTEARQLGSQAKRALLADPNISNPQIAALVERLVANNKHQITTSSGGMIKVDDDGVIKTPLGIITQSSVQQAREVLNELAKFTDTSSAKYTQKLEEYLTLVPQKVAARRGWHETFLADEKYAQQADFLDQLEKSYDWYQQTLETEKSAKEKTDDEDVSGLFRYRLSTLEDTKVFDQIDQMFRGSSNQQHRQASGYKLKYVYQLENKVDQDAFEESAERLKNVQRLWHGTNVANVLSIMSKGLYVPSHGGGVQITGRMFGNGVYFSNQSTKSLNYSIGWWSGRASAQQGYMFLADVVLGKEYHPRSSGSHANVHKTHDSIYVAPGTAGVMNNEVIVWNTNQIMLKYLCEFSR